MLLGGAWLAMTMAAGLLCLSRVGWRFAASGFALFLPTDFCMDTRFLCLPMVMLILAFRVSQPAGRIANIQLDRFIWLTLGLLSTGLAILALIKGSFAAASLGTIIIVCVLLFGTGFRRPAASCMAIFIVAIPVFWRLARQPLSSLPLFLCHEISIVSGYSAAMATAGPLWRVGLFLDVCLLLLLLNRRLFTADFSGFCLLSGMALLLFLGFKEGFVQYDFAHIPAAAGIAGMAGWGVLLSGPVAIEPLASLIAMLVCRGVILHIYTGPIFAGWVNLLDAPYRTAARSIVARCEGTLDPARSYADSLDGIRASDPMPKLTGPTDIYSYDQAALLAAALDWSPRPVFQSYSAYTPELLRLNAAHLIGANAHKILFSRSNRSTADSPHWRTVQAGRFC